MWTHDGIRHRLAGPDSITVLDSDPPTFELAVEVDVTVSGQRYSATFMTAEQVRESDAMAGQWRFAAR